MSGGSIKFAIDIAARMAGAQKAIDEATRLKKSLDDDASAIRRLEAAQRRLKGLDKKGKLTDKQAGDLKSIEGALGGIQSRLASNAAAYAKVASAADRAADAQKKLLGISKQAAQAQSKAANEAAAIEARLATARARRSADLQGFMRTRVRNEQLGAQRIAAAQQQAASASARWNSNVRANIGSYDRFNQATSSAASSTDGLSASTDKFGASAGAAGVAIAATTAILLALAAAAGWVATKVWAAVGVVSRAHVAFRNLTGSAAAGRDALKDTIDLAAKLGLPVEQTVKQMQKLLAMQFDRGTATEIIKMGAALKALGATGDQVDRVILAMSQIKSAGKLQGDELMQLAEAGVSVELIYKSLEKRLGKSREEIMRLKEAGKIAADDATAAILDAVKMKSPGGDFDSLIAQVGATLPGKIDLLSSAWERFVLKVGDFASGPLLEAFGPVIDDIINMLNSAGGSGVFAGIADALSSVGQVVGVVWPAIKGFFRGMVEGFGALAPSGDALKSLFDFLGSTEVIAGATALFRGLGFVIGAVAGFIANLATGLAFLFGLIAGGLGKLIEFKNAFFSIGDAIMASLPSFGDIGMAIVEGIASAITNGTSSVISAVLDLVSQAKNAAKEGLGIASPSKVFRSYGEQTTKGFVQGIQEGQGGVQGAVTQMLAAPQAAAQVVNQGGSTGPSIQIGQLTISGVERAEQVPGLLREALTKLLEGASVEVGAQAPEAAHA